MKLNLLQKEIWDYTIFYDFLLIYNYLNSTLFLLFLVWMQIALLCHLFQFEEFPVYFL